MTGLALIVGTLTLSSCSSNATDASLTEKETPASEAISSSKSAEPANPTATPESADVPVPAGLVGTGCAGYAVKVPAGPGSLDGMSSDPAAVALSNSPQLTTLSNALSGNLNSEVNMVDALNKGQFTVFAPLDDAWGRLSPETLDKLRGNSTELTAVLNYHLVPGQLAPDQVVGEHKSVQGGTLNVTGSGEDLRVNDAVVVCGGIRTTNATVYLIDTVLMPPAPPPPSTTGTATPGSSSPESSSPESSSGTATTSSSSTEPPS
ncbi:MAG: fasciclin domain-containing protein [Mycobacterium sp.]|nr:fasciclin domain-containing protein [Mycobacterium sp.]